MSDVPQVGVRNASLGEMVVNLADAGVRVPGGFATTADASTGLSRRRWTGCQDPRYSPASTSRTSPNSPGAVRYVGYPRPPVPRAPRRDIRAGYDKAGGR